MRDINAICSSAVLTDGDKGVRFRVRFGGQILTAFAIRYRGRVYAYLNQCAHQGIELDWKEGYFFDMERRFLICATHGALYHPDTGHCAGGPCRGGALVPLAVAEENNVVRLQADDVRLVNH
jgi:nitrite reductase/ring-hydroxylating ferredoxin subunit